MNRNELFLPYSKLSLDLYSMTENPKKFKLDRNAFEARSASEPVNYGKDHQKLTWQERMKIHRYLNSIAYGYDIDNPPRLDKTAFSVRSRK
jgi:hypothetical protein